VFGRGGTATRRRRRAETARAALGRSWESETIWKGVRRGDVAPARRRTPARKSETDEAGPRQPEAWKAWPPVDPPASSRAWHPSRLGGARW